MASGNIEITPGRVLSLTELVDNAKLNDLGSPVARLAAGAVTSRELADGQITADKLAGTVSAQLGVADGSVTTAKIVDDAVTEAKIAAGSVSAGKLKSTLITDFSAGTDIRTGDYLLVHDVSAGGPPIKALVSDVLNYGIAILSDTKSDGTAGGASVLGAWNTRTLNTIDVNPQSIVSALAANAFTLVPGNYLIRARVPAFGSSNHKARLYNVTSGSVAAIGTSENSGTAAQTASEILAYVSPAVNTQYRIEHRVKASNALDGLGQQSSFGSNEIYTVVEIIRMGRA